MKIDKAFAAEEARRLANEIADLLAKVAGEVYIEEVVAKRYTDQNENKRFVELDPYYAEEKLNAVGFTHPILVREGPLLKAVRKNHKQKVSAGAVTITFTLPSYAMWHETGADSGQDHDVPVRRPVAPNASDAKVLIDGIVRRLKGRK